MKRATIIIILICILVLAALACKGGGDPTPGGWTPTEGSPGTDWGAQATRGAEEFHAQLTAIQRDLEAAGTEEP